MTTIMSIPDSEMSSAGIVSSTQSSHNLYKLAVYHEEMNPRKRSTMEDCHRIIPLLLRQDRVNYSYFAVYDGHGGRGIVDFLEERLENNIVTELQLNDNATIGERLTRAYLITDMESKQNDLTTSGATAVSALLRTEISDTGALLSRTLYTANAGDSRAVIAYRDKNGGYTARRLTYDHRSEDESEQKRIKDAGGFITRARVLGILAVTRSFGDHGMKDFVSAEPYLSETDLLAFDDCPMLIIACDGVWDVLTDQEAVDLLMEPYQQSGPYTNAAEILVSLFISLGFCCQLHHVSTAGTNSLRKREHRQYHQHRCISVATLFQGIIIDIKLVYE
jgi:serine/threonine protein phosphatase PrpC